MKCADCKGKGHRYAGRERYLMACRTCQGTGEVEPCIACGQPAREDYAGREDSPCCGREACGRAIQVGLDYQEEVGNR